MTPTKFSMRIEKLANDSESTYLDALLDYCEKNSVDVVFPPFNFL